MNLFFKICEYNNALPLTQTKVSHKNLHENFPDALIPFSFKNIEFSINEMNAVFILRFFPVDKCDL